MDSLKNKVLIGIIVILTLVIAFEGVYIFKHWDKDQEVENKENIDTSNEENQDNSVAVSRDSILKLAEDSSLHIYTEFNPSIYVDDPDIYLEFNGNHLYLTQYGNQSLVSNFSEEVVNIKDAHNSCAACEDHILLLTSEGNLYQLRGAALGYSRFSSDILSKINHSEDVLLELEKLNSDDIKVWAFIDANGDGRDYSCGFPTQYIYTSDGKVREYDTFREVERFVVDYAGTATSPGGNYGFVIYNDKTVSVNNQDLVYNKDNELLYIKNYYHSNNEDLYIVDENDYLYIERYLSEGLSSPTIQASYQIELYKNSKIKSINEENSTVQIIFEDNSILNIEVK